MFSSIKTLLKKAIFNWRQKKSEPIVSPHYDMKLLQKVKGKFSPSWEQLRHLRHLLTPSEGRVIKISLLFLLIGILLGGIKLAYKYRVEIPALGGSVVEAVVGGPQFINPIFSSNNDVDTDIVRLVYSGLMRFDGKGRLVPDMAVKYDISQDKKIYNFELRKDAVWHDGEPFTSKDIVFTIETIQNSQVASPLYVSFQGVAVKAIDDYNLLFTLPEPYSGFLPALTVGILPEHVWFNVLPEQMRLAQTNWQPVGTGPFRFNRLTKDEKGRVYSYELVRFENYYRQPPFLNSFTFQFYTEYEGDEGAVQALRSQKVDSLSFVPKNLRDKIERKHISLKTLKIPQYSALFFNQQKNAVLKDKDVRIALSQAIDKERILREAVRGEGQIIHSPVLPDSPGYNPELKKINYSPQDANTLLDKNWQRVTAEEYRKIKRDALVKELGGPASSASSTDSAASSTISEELEKEINKRLDEELNNTQTFYRKNKNGQWLEINLVTVGTEEYKQASGIIAGFWQEIGVKTNISYVAVRDFNRDVLKTRDYDVLLYGEIMGSDPNQYPFWHSSQVDYPGLNLSNYINRNVDSILQKMQGVSDETEKAELYRKFQETILEDNPAVFLYMPTYTYALADKIKGVDIERISQPADRFADIASWYENTGWKWK